MIKTTSIWHAWSDKKPEYHREILACTEGGRLYLCYRNQEWGKDKFVSSDNGNIDFDISYIRLWAYVKPPKKAVCGTSSQE